MLYDLHIHSCLSPCADDDMTPANIAGMAKVAGLDLIAVADHNSARNLPAVKNACDFYGVKLLPAIEVNTEEEIHMLAYFPTVEAALEYGKILYDALPEFPYDASMWGRQLVMNEDDEIIDEVDKLLTGAVSLGIYEAKELCEKMGGIAVPAHVEKDSFSLLSVLGFLPDDLSFAAFEAKNPDKLAPLIERGFLPAGKETLSSSDAHFLGGIAETPRELAEDSVLRKLL